MFCSQVSRQVLLTVIFSETELLEHKHLCIWSVALQFVHNRKSIYRTPLPKSLIRASQSLIFPLLLKSQSPDISLFMWSGPTNPIKHMGAGRTLPNIQIFRCLLVIFAPFLLFLCAHGGHLSVYFRKLLREDVILIANWPRG